MNSNQPSILPITMNGVQIIRNKRTLLNISEFTFDAPNIKGGITVLIGPNGAGKTMLLRMMAGLEVPKNDQALQGQVPWGQILWNGLTPNRLRQRQLGVVLQRPIVLRRTVLANLAYAFRLTGLSHALAKNEAKTLLNAHRLEHLAGQYAPALSGGEQQYISLLRTMILRPNLLLLDEPTASLDPNACFAIESLVKQIADSKIPCLFVTHNIQQARRLADYVIFMNKGELTPIQSASAFFEQPASADAQAFLDGVL